MRGPRAFSEPIICASSRKRARRPPRARSAPGPSSPTAAASCLSAGAHTTPTCGRAMARSRPCVSRKRFTLARSAMARRRWSQCVPPERGWWTSPDDGFARCGSSSRQLARQLDEDIEELGPHLTCATPAGAIVVGSRRVCVEEGANVEPQVVFDVTNGPDTRASRRDRAGVHAARGAVRGARKRHRARRPRERVLDRRIQHSPRRDLARRSSSAMRTKGTTASSGTRISAGG